MKNCKRCGSSIDDTAIFCPVCGERQGASYYYSPFGADNRGGSYSAVTDKTNIWIAAIGFISPLIGLLLWYLWRYRRPSFSVSVSRGALAGACFGTPIIGLVVWLLFRHTNPTYAKIAGISAIVGAAFALTLSVVSTVLTMLDVTIFGYTVPEILNFFYYMGI